jgi:hypothetical protein
LLTINAGAYTAEIMRAGVEAIPRGQTGMRNGDIDFFNGATLPPASFAFLPSLLFCNEATSPLFPCEYRIEHPCQKSRSAGISMSSSSL